MNSSQSQHNLIIKQKSKLKKSKYFELQSSDDDQQNQQDHEYDNINQKVTLIKQNPSNKPHHQKINKSSFPQYQQHQQQQSYIKLLQQNQQLTSQNNKLKQQNKQILQQKHQLQKQNTRLLKELQEFRRYFNNNNVQQNNEDNRRMNTNEKNNKNNLNRHFHTLHDKHSQQYLLQDCQHIKDEQIPPLAQIQLPVNTPLLQHYPQFKHQLLQFFPHRKIASLTHKFKASSNNFHIDQFYKSCGHIKNTVILCITNTNKIIGGFSPWEHKYTGEYRDKEWLYAYDIDKLWLTKEKGEKYQIVSDMNKETFLFQLQYKGKQNYYNDKGEEIKENYHKQENINMQQNYDLSNYKHRKFPLKNSKISIQRHQKNKCIYFGSGQLIIGQYPYFYYQYKMKQKQDYNTCMSFNIYNNLSSYDFSQNESSQNRQNSQSFSQPHLSYQFTPSQYLNLGNYFNLYNPAFTTKYQNQSEYIFNKLNWLQKQNKPYKNQLLWNGNKSNVFMLREYECYEVVFDDQNDKQKEIKMFYNSKVEVHKALLNNHKLLNKKINKQKAMVLIQQLNSSHIISQKSPHILSSILSLFQNKIVSSLQLLYKASSHQFSTKQFFEQCGNFHSCLFLIQTTNNCIIGAYTPLYFNLLTEYDSSLQDGSNESFTFTLPNSYDTIEKFTFANKSNSIRRIQSDKNIRFGGGMIVLQDKNDQGWSYLSNSVYINNKFKNIKDNYMKYMKQDSKYFYIKQWQVIQVGFKQK